MEAIVSHREDFGTMVSTSPGFTDIVIIFPDLHLLSDGTISTDHTKYTALAVLIVENDRSKQVLIFDYAPSMYDLPHVFNTEVENSKHCKIHALAHGMGVQVASLLANSGVRFNTVRFIEPWIQTADSMRRVVPEAEAKEFRLEYFQRKVGDWERIKDIPCEHLSVFRMNSDGELVEVTDITLIQEEPICGHELGLNTSNKIFNDLSLTKEELVDYFYFRQAALCALSM
jgi:hypothetical protein